MPTATHHPDRIAALRRLPPTQLVAAIAAAIDHADEPERELLAIELLDICVGAEPDARDPAHPPIWTRVFPRSRRARALAAGQALGVLARSWPRLPLPTRETALAVGRGRWTGAVAAACRDADAGVRRSAATLAAEAADAALGGPMCSLLSDADPEVVKAAETSLVQTAARLIGARASRPDGGPTPREPARLGQDPGARRAFEAQIAAAVRAYPEHRRRAVLLASLVLLDRLPAATDPDNPLMRWLNEPDDPSVMAARSVLRKSTDAVTRARAWTWLAHPALAAAALDRLSRAATAAEHDVVLTRAHLALHPVRGARLRLLRANARAKGGAPVPPPDMIPSLSVAARRGLGRWIGGIGLNAPGREAALAPLLTDEDASVRHAAAMSAGQRLVLDFCFDPDLRVARTALFRWSTAGIHDAPEPDRAVARLARHPDEQIRAIAAQEAQRLDPWNPSTPHGRIAARRALRDRGEGFIAQLRGRIADGSEHDRVNAILTARRLEIAGRVELELLSALDRNGDSYSPRVAASAVTALGRCTTDAAADAVGACLHDPDPRIRANAVEAAGRRATTPDAQTPNGPAPDNDLYGALLELKDDDHHRVRANAVRRILSAAAASRVDAARGPVFEPAAAESLVSMLGDGREGHRVAGLWLTERLLVSGLGGGLGGGIPSRIGELAEGSGPETARARRCQALLMGSVRDRWRRRAPSLSDEPTEAAAP